MSDVYLDLANSGIGKKVFSALGLPEPVALVREDPQAPHQLSGSLLLGTSTGARFTDIITSLLQDTGVAMLRDAPMSARHLIFDASGIATADDSTQLYEFFHQYIANLDTCGRVIVVGLQPSSADNPEHASLQRGLHGFVKSLAKEIGRKGATANLLLVGSGGEIAIAAPIRFLLSGGSAFMNAQVLTTARAVASMDADWQRPLQDKTVVVTGAARGIGLAIAEVLTRDGARVIGVDVPQAEDELRSNMDRLKGLSLPLDITIEGADVKLCDYCLSLAPTLHGVVHNAGVTRDKMLSRMSEQQWTMLMQVNLGAVQRINAALLATDLLDDGGKIVGVASISGIAGNIGQTNYAFSKAAVIGVVENLAPLCAARGITINAVAPGFIETQMTAAIPFVTRQIGRRLSSLGQGGMPVDVAEVIGLFVSPQASGINGNVVRVCGQSLLGA
ncbi:MAG: 3-oxoacyl-ACP reductase [Porticoccaceae bacterium]|nr:3-oxoacyl-ACP reductase [Porticoccaceae bacterium]